MDNKPMVLNLCFSPKYLSYSHFLTYKCNQKRHFGACPIKNCIESGGWKINYPNFYSIEYNEQKENEEAVLISSDGILMSV